MCALSASAQQSVSNDDAIPDAPSAVLAAQQQQPGGTPPQTGAGGPQQTKRILGIVPNFRAVSADTKLPPQTVKQKFSSTIQQSFDYSSIVFSAILAGVNQAEDSTPQFHQGAAGYGRYFWHTFADQTDENFMVQAIVPSLTHEDSRYYTMGHGGLLKRGLYAFDRTLITRTDSGSETFNFSEIVGAGAASGISTTYYPGADKTWTKTGQRWLQNVIIDGGTYMFQEFWPDINNRFIHQKD
ncbi:hypothetical protein [Acidipila sp. EB88]|uniref:hypothetical protein n=1 Tax=Acidipila sp. EB88 TaxID=2305226 RepID=UPI000F5FF1CC|nr:hypothetical protein [Acidipila sp. EB88]RRA47855.1 hypothetical protein D1Y84_05655 [Acidipila sp. EB88]